MEVLFTYDAYYSLYSNVNFSNADMRMLTTDDEDDYTLDNKDDDMTASGYLELEPSDPVNKIEVWVVMYKF